MTTGTPTRWLLLAVTVCVLGLTWHLTRERGEPELYRLVEDASSADKSVRYRAIIVLDSYYGDRALPALAALVNALSEPDHGVVAAAARCLGKIGKSARRGLPAIVELLSSDRPATVKTACAIAIGKISENPQLCVPALRMVLRDGTADVGSVLMSLEQFGPSSAEAVPEIVSYLGAADDTAESALLALDGIGEAAAPAIPAIVAVLEDPQRDEFLKEIAGGTLASIGPAAVAALIALVRDHGNLQALDALGEIGPSARSAVPAVIGVLEVPERYPGRSWNRAAAALTVIGFDVTWTERVRAALTRAAALGAQGASTALERLAGR